MPLTNVVQNEFAAVRDFLHSQGEGVPDNIKFTNEPPSFLGHTYLARTGGFFQWTMPVQMSRKWELQRRALSARIMALFIYSHWEASDRPASMNVARAVTTKTADKVLWFLDI